MRSALDRIEALILAGGKGTRLASVLSDKPKVLAEVGGRPFLSYLLDQLSDGGFERVVLCVGHQAGIVQDAFGATYRRLKLEYSEESIPLGTGGALRRAFPLISSDPVLVMNGDSYCDLDLRDFVKEFYGVQSEIGMAVVPEPVCRHPEAQRIERSKIFHSATQLFRVAHADRESAKGILLQPATASKRFGLVHVDKNRCVMRFSEKGKSKGEGWINAGIYLFRRALIEGIPSQRAVSLEEELFPLWIKKGIFGYAKETSFIDIGTPETYGQAASFFKTVCA